MLSGPMIGSIFFFVLGVIGIAVAAWWLRRNTKRMWNEMEQL